MAVDSRNQDKNADNDNQNKAGRNTNADSNRNRNDVGDNRSRNESYRDVNAERASRYSTQMERDAIARGDYSSAGNLGNLKPGEGYESLTGWERLKAGIKALFGIGKTLGSLSGGPLGAVSSVKSAKSSALNLSEAITGQKWHTAEDTRTTAPNVGSTQAQTGNENQGQERAQAGLADLMKETSTPTTEPKKADPIADWFTALARSKKGYRSTMLGSGIGNVSQPKGLLGE